MPSPEYERFLHRTLSDTLRRIRQRLARASDRDPMVDEGDVAQEVYLKLLLRWGSWEQPEPEPPPAWFDALVANAVRDALRFRRAEKRERARTLALADLDPGEDAARALLRLVDGEDEERLRRALAELPERERAAVVLRHLEGLAYREVGERLELSTSGAKHLVERVLTQLHHRLRP